VLTHHARAGSEGARSRILALVASPVPEVRAQAVMRTYAFAVDRRLAQREMRRRMHPADYHLLFQY
jgi:hypothetical protein